MVIDLVAKYYPLRGLVDFLHAHAEGYIIKEGIGDHESLDPKQVEVTSTAFFIIIRSYCNSWRSYWAAGGCW